MCNISPNIFFDAAIAESVRRNNVDEADDDDDVATVDIDDVVVD